MDIMFVQHSTDPGAKPIGFTMKYRGTAPPELSPFLFEIAHEHSTGKRGAGSMPYRDQFSIGARPTRDLIIDPHKPYVALFLSAFEFPEESMRILDLYFEECGLERYLPQNRSIGLREISTDSLEQWFILGKIPAYLREEVHAEIIEIGPSSVYREALEELMWKESVFNRRMQPLLDAFPGNPTLNAMLQLLHLEVRGLFNESIRHEVGLRYYHKHVPLPDHHGPGVANDLFSQLSAHTIMVNRAIQSPGLLDPAALRVKLGLQ